MKNVLILFALPLAAQENMLTSSDPFQCFTRLDGSPRVVMSVVDTDGPGFTRAWRLTTRELATNP